MIKIGILGCKSSQRYIMLILVTLGIYVSYNSVLKYFSHHVTLLSFYNVCIQSPMTCKVQEYYDPVVTQIHENMPSLVSHPNFPELLLTAAKLPSMIPDIQDIRWSGIHWQESKRDYPKFLLYSAHFDDRELARDCNNSYIRILGLYSGNYAPAKKFCQIWFSEFLPPLVVPVSRYDLIDWQGFSSNKLLPYLLSCKIPRPDEIPVAVSLVEAPCEKPSNLLQVTGTFQDSQKLEGENNASGLSIGICGPALYYFNEDFHHRLIEWIEIMDIVGASKIILYKTAVHQNVQKVLDYYEKRGQLKILSFHYPPPYVDEGSLRRFWTETKRGELFSMENIYFTDCVLRFKDQFDYLAHFDPDEVPILKKHSTLAELIIFLKKGYSTDFDPASLHLVWRTFYFETGPGESAANIPKSFHILRHNRHPASILTSLDYNGKSIYNTNKILAVLSHKPHLLADGSQGWKQNYQIDASLAFTAHYRCQECGSKCDNVEFVEEKTLLKHSKRVVDRVDSVIKELNLSN